MNKNLLLSLIGLLPGLAQAAPLPTHFTTNTAVYYVGQPQTKLQLTIYEESPESWAYLTVSAWDPESYKPQQDILQKAYPGLSVERVLGRGTGKATITIGVLGISREVDWEPYQNGPGVNSIFELTKAQTLAAMTSKDLRVSISGKVKAYVNEVNVVETKTVSASDYCDALLKNGSSVGQIILSYPKVSKMIDGLTTRFSETKKNLKKAVLRQCLEVPGTTVIGSFMDLLETKVFAAHPAVLIGETWTETPTEKEGDFSSAIPKTITSTVGG